MSIKYSKSKIGNINSNKLTKEINNNTTIITSLDYINILDINSNNFDIYFLSSLTSEEETELDNIINNHDSTIKNFKQTDTQNIDENININLLGLHKESIFDSFGCIVTKNYYKNYDGTTYSDLVVKDEYVYNINSNDLVTYRDETISWYLDDDTIGHIKTFRKYYNLNHSIKEGLIRRTNLIDKAKAYGLPSITGTHISGIPNSHYFFESMENELYKYRSGTNKQELIDFINNSTETFITQQIKDDLVGILKYWI